MTILDAIAGDEIDQESGERIEKWFYVGDEYVLYSHLPYSWIGLVIWVC